MNNSTVKIFSDISELRNILKQVQQLSWTITQFEKKYPFEHVQEWELEEIKTAYLKFGEQLIKIAEELNNKMKLNEYGQSENN